MTDEPATTPTRVDPESLEAIRAVIGDLRDQCAAECGPESVLATWRSSRGPLTIHAREDGACSVIPPGGKATPADEWLAAQEDDGGSTS